MADDFPDIFWTSWQKADSLHNKGKYKHAGLVKEAIPMRPDIDRASRDGVRRDYQPSRTVNIINFPPMK